MGLGRVKTKDCQMHEYSEMFEVLSDISIAKSVLTLNKYLTTVW